MKNNITYKELERIFIRGNDVENFTTLVSTDRTVDQIFSGNYKTIVDWQDLETALTNHLLTQASKVKSLPLKAIENMETLAELINVVKLFSK